MNQSLSRAANPYGLSLVEDCLHCTLRTSAHFCELPPEVLAVFEQIQQPTAYPEGALLFVEGQSPRGAFMVCKGRVKLSITSPNGKTIIVKIAGPGELIGMNATLQGRPYDATAETLQTAQVNFIRREDFLKFLHEHGEATFRAAEHLSRSCHAAYDQIRSIGLSASAPEKLARLLLDWARDGENTKQGIRVRLALTHEEIAQVIGSSRETVTRTLGMFKKKQMAELKGSTLLIRDQKALQALVDAAG